MRRRKCSFLRNKRQTAAHRSSFLVQILCTSRYRGTIKKQTKKNENTPLPTQPWPRLVIGPFSNWNQSDTEPSAVTGLPELETTHADKRQHFYLWIQTECTTIQRFTTENNFASIRHGAACLRLLFFLLKALNISIVVLQKLGVCLAT